MRFLLADARVLKASLALLFLFAGLEFFMPLRTALQIGADEGFELAKATSCLHGYKLYTEIWNDQPPLHTFLITQALKHISHKVLVPRLVTVVLGAVLIASFFMIVARFSGLLTALLATALLLASPGFLELTSSCMLEVPSFSCAIAGLSLLCISPSVGTRRSVTIAFSGLVLACGLEMKLLSAYLVPLAGLLILVKSTGLAQPGRVSGNKAVTEALLFGFFVVIGVIAIDLAVAKGTYLAHFGQSWRAHFTAPKSFDIGSPDEHPFDWTILLKNWDITLPALLGLGFSARALLRSSAVPLDKQGHRTSPEKGSLEMIRRALANPGAIIPISWLSLSFLLFSTHKPWWAYYYIHLAVPFSWCAAIGILSVLRTVGDDIRRLKNRLPSQSAVGTRSTASDTNLGRDRLSPLWRFSGSRTLVAGIFLLSSFAWAGARVYFEIRDVRALPKTFSAPVISRIARLNPPPRFMFTDESVYSFHTGVPMPPDLAVVSLKRFWAGDLTPDRLVADLQATRPEVLLLANNSKPVLFQTLLETRYRLTYVDSRHRLFLRTDVKPAGR